MLKRIIQNNNLGPLAYKEFYRVLLHLSISSRRSNDCSKRISNVLDVYACRFSGCVCFLFSGICEDTCCTQEHLYSVCVEIVRLTDSGLALGAHVLSEHVQKCGVELAALSQLRREAVVMFLHFQMLVSLSTQQVKRPCLLSHRSGLQLFTGLQCQKVKGQRYCCVLSSSIVLLPVRVYDTPEEQGALVHIVCSSGSRKKPQLRILEPFVHTLCALLMGPRNGKNMDKIVTPWICITGLLKKELVIEIYTIK